MPPSTATTELAIERALKRQSSVDGPSFYHRYRVFRERVLDNEYCRTMAGFPGGNDHGPKHIIRVMANLDGLLGGRPRALLTEYELFLAMMGVLYHDVGILRGREGHAATSAKLLTEEKASFILDETDTTFVSAIVLSHSGSVTIEKGPRDQHVRGHDIRPRLVAALGL
jgi:hypothetical protein